MERRNPWPRPRTQSPSPAPFFYNLAATYTISVNSPQDDVLIIGGGAIGLATALALLDAGHGVRVLDAGKAGSGA